MSQGEPRQRRAPPRLRLAEVRSVEWLSPRMARVTLAGPELVGLAAEEPAASVRLLLPPITTGEVVVPTWNGNEFLLPDGRRPTLRTFTPRRADPEAGQLVLDIVLHGRGAASDWASAARAGDRAAISGPGRGYLIDARATAYLLVGDETAMPAISQLLEAIPAHAAVVVHIEVAQPDARQPLPLHPGATLHWCELPPGAAPGDALLEGLRAGPLPLGTRVWAAGEAAAMQRVRRHVFDERGLPRGDTSIRGYWKHGRAGDISSNA